MACLLRRLWRDNAGISALEFAMILPIMLMLSIGTFEVSRMIMLHHKLQNGSFILADLVARDRTINEAQVANIFLAIGSLIRPFDFDANGTVILTSVGALSDDVPFVNWQRVGGGALHEPSAIGTSPGGPAVLPDGLSIRATETVIVAEVVFDYAPFFGLFSGASIIRKMAFYKPRLGTLEEVLP